MTCNSREFRTGDNVLPRPDGAVELLRWERRHIPGVVIGAADLRHCANGYRIKVRWTDDQSETGFMDAALFDRA